MATPNKRIVQFIERLPATIRDSVRTQIILFFDDAAGWDRESDLDLLARSLIDPPVTGSRFAKSHAAVLVSAALDFIFEHGLSGQSEELQELAEAIDSASLRKAALELPLRKKHFDQASTTWRELRQSDLSLQALQEYHASLASDVVKD